MPLNFNDAAKAYKNDKIKELGKTAEGLRFLKIRSMGRREYLERLAAEHSVDISDVGASDLLRYLYESAISDEEIKKTINAIYADERQVRVTEESDLVTELYKLRIFDWGGLHQNSLEKTIVDNYIKKIRSYDRLNDNIENELHNSLRGYVQCSWYNHWTSILIEDIFKDHPNVLPTVGLIKKIDFFVNDVPFDLKVTYMPEGFIKDKRKEMGLRPELTELKHLSRKIQLAFDSSIPDGKLLEILWSMIKDHPSAEAQEKIREIEGCRQNILRRAMEAPKDLIIWLYENQGVRRFDSSNRLFIVLVNSDNFFESWKLKRAKDLLIDKVHSYLDDSQSGFGNEIEFNWEGNKYQTTSDIIFVVHNSV